MAGVHYVNCEHCGKQYYLDSLLYDVVKANPEQKLRCPFCKREFTLKEGHRSRPA